MPFTLAHAAAALPLRRLKLVTSALVIGTLAPDFEYFIRISDSRRDFHHFPGLILFTAPLALIVLWLFHRLLKEPLVALAPEGLQLKLAPYMKRFAFGGVGRFAAILGSLAIGIATHLLWDSFTHPDTWTFRHIAWLRQGMVISLFGSRHFLYRCSVLQYASSILGCVALVVWFAVWYRRAAPSGISYKPVFTPGRRLVIALAIIALPWTVGLALAMLQGRGFEDFLHFKTFAQYLILVPGTLLCMEVLIYSLFTTRLLRLQRVQHG